MAKTTLTESEEVRWSGTVSHLHYFGKWLVIVVLLGVLAASYLLPAVQQSEFVWPLRGVALLLAVVLFFWIQLDRSRRRYTVTNGRVIVEFGIVSKQSNEIRIQDIRSINLHRSGLPGLLGIGRVEFSSAATDDAEVVFWNTPDAEKVRDLVRALQS